MVIRCVLTSKDRVHLSHGEEGWRHHNVRGVRARASCERIVSTHEGITRLRLGLHLRRTGANITGDTTCLSCASRGDRTVPAVSLNLCCGKLRSSPEHDEESADLKCLDCARCLMRTDASLRNTTGCTCALCRTLVLVSSRCFSTSEHSHVDRGCDANLYAVIVI